MVYYFNYKKRDICLNGYKIGDKWLAEDLQTTDLNTLLS